MANPEHLAVVGQGKEAIAEWRRAHPRKRLDLSGADLRRADLRRADLSGADLSGANLTWADLSRANLTWVNLSRANLMRANLSRADLGLANLSWANLSRANLGRVLLFITYLRAADLTEADLSQGMLGRTVLADVDVSQVAGLATVKHIEPSTIGVDTLIRSFRGAGNTLTPELAAFFRGAGVPQELLEALPRILAEVKYYTCFVCYGQPDLEFAQKLCKDLEARGVSCWLYDMDATPGERTWREIGRKRREAEKMVVLCSAKALVRDGALKEIEEQIDEDPDKMVPISLDDLWKEKGARVMRGDRDLKPYLLDKNYADFANLSYEEALERLLAGLKRPTPSAT
jgi:uncharacterized protein YjbI with pentapeptide repeats